MKKVKSTAILLFLAAAGWSANAPANGNEGNAIHEASLFKLLIIPFGVATFLSIAATLTLGLKMAKNRAAIFPWHRRLALVTMLLAICHVSLVLIFH